MYETVMTSAIAPQGYLANAYVASDHAPNLGLYLLGQNRATLSYSERVEPPEAMKAVHTAFLEWQRSGIDVLAEALRRRDPRTAAASRRYADATRAFAEAFEALPQPATPEDP
jgi:hypothetical protein